MRDVLEAVGRVEKYTFGGREAFARDELIQVRVVHHLQIIGEAVRAPSTDLTSKHPEVPWQQIAGMRNILVRHHFGVDVAAVWSVVERDLPARAQSVSDILESQP